MKSHSLASLEPLESRIAPAAIIGTGGKTATFTDVDGDLVTVTTTRGVLDAGMFAFNSQNLGEQLAFLHLDSSFKGANISVTAKPQAGAGDGLANVVELTAPVDLGKVRIDGDLCSLEVGDNDAAVRGLGSLTVNSLGLLGHIDNYVAGTVYAHHSAGKITVLGDDYSVSIGSDGGFGAIKIGGSLIGGDSATDGEVFVGGRVGSILIGGSLVGGNGQAGASLFLNDVGKIAVGGSLHGFAQGTASILAGNIGSLTIGGNVEGAFGNGSASVRGTVVGSITIRGDVLGGTGMDSAEVRANASLGKLVIGGSVRGGTNDNSGFVYVNGDCQSASVGGEVVGGDGKESGGLDFQGSISMLRIGGDIHGGSGEMSGVVQVADGAASAFVGGSVLGGSGITSGALSINGTSGTVRVAGDIIGGTAFISGGLQCQDAQKVLVGGDVRGGTLGFNAPADLQHTGYVAGSRIGSLTIGGSLVAGSDFSPFHSLQNSGEIAIEKSVGQLLIKGGIAGNDDVRALVFVKGGATGKAIGKLTVGGSVEIADILAGAYPFSAMGNPDAQIGTVTIGGNFVSSNLSAGVDPGADLKYGTNDDMLYGNAPVGTGQIASIANVIVKGQIVGTLTAGDHYGIVAEKIGKVQLGKTVLGLPSGVVDLLVGYSADASIKDLA